MKQFARLMTAAVLGFACLTGCAELTAIKDAIQTGVATKITQKEAYLAASAFDVAEITATQYLRLPICSVASGPICREPVATPRIQGAILAGRSSRNNIKAYLRAHINDGADSAISTTSDYNALQAATDTIQALTQAYRAATGN